MKEKLKFIRGKLGYGIGAIGLDLSYGLFYSYLAKYLTDVLLMPAAFLLILTPIARIWDGINDPMMGTIVDNTSTKFGKYRPWIVIGACSNAIVLALSFTNPGFRLGGIPLYMYVAIMYILWGMTNTMADIPYWSMIPSFTNDPGERNLVSTLARTFSGLGQGIVTIFTPIMLVALGSGSTDAEKKLSAQGFSRWAIICAVLLIVFALISVSLTKEKNVIKTKEKFSFGQAIKIAKSNDQLLIFMLFAMLSNAGWYLTSGVGAYYFDVVVGDITKQSTFSLFGAVGSILGLFVIPIGTKFTTRRRTYQFSLGLSIFGYIGMMIAARSVGSLMLMNVFYVIASLGIGSMFVAQTIFLADIVDYGEIKLGFRAESITFSMKGFLQKMAYTLQTVILFTGLGLSHYDGLLGFGNSQASKSAITFMMLIAPPVLMILSLLVFTFKFKLYGSYMDEITQKISEKRKGETE